MSFKNIDWSCAPNVVLGFGVMGYALWAGDWTFDPLKVVVFLVLFLSGAGLAYGFLLMLTSASIWFMRNQSLYEMWWLFSTLMRYPSEIFRDNWAAVAAGWFFSFAVPIMLVTNVPVRVMVKTLEPWSACYAIGSALVVVLLSRLVFRAAMQRYRSASS